MAFAINSHMARSVDPERYRQEALRLREKAAKLPTNDPELRASYLGLAAEYEHLAELLEKGRPPT